MSVRLLSHPFGEVVLSRLAEASRSLFLCTPYVTDTVFETRSARRLMQRLPRLTVTLLCNMSLKNVASGATDPRGVIRLSARARAMHINHHESLHAKVYVADSACAVVTSANLTIGGFYRNVEYGVLIEDRTVVARILADLQRYTDLGASLDPGVLERIAALAPRIQQAQTVLRTAVVRRLPPDVRREYRHLEDELLRRKLRGEGTVNAIFSRTILYVLAHGPLDTSAIHERIREIHPDLCDDRVDRVIGERHFGKKWKHAVRNAQQHLRRRGLIEWVDRRWRLTEPATTDRTT